LDDVAFEEALAAAAAGAEWAFARLWRALQPPLLRYLRVAGAEFAEDLASEVWLEVARGLPRFRGDMRAFRAWLFTVARHRAIDRHRHLGRRPAEDLMRDLADRPGAPDPADIFEQTLSTEAALDLIQGLPPDQAEAITLRVVGELDVAEVAQIMGKRPGAIRILTHRGLRRLEAQLADPPEEQPEP